MLDIWHALENQTRTWHALQRQGLADAIWSDYVSMRFGRTGDPRALEYLYPYLNHAHKEDRFRAIEVAARVFEGRGTRALDALDYFVKHPDPFLRDRAVQVVGAAVAGSPDRVLLEVLGPYLDHRNAFIRKSAVVALGRAAEGRGSEALLGEIQRVAEHTKMSTPDVDMSIARLHSGCPTEKVYGSIVGQNLVDAFDRDNEKAVALLVQGASDEWYSRVCHDAIEPRLHADESTGWMRQFIQRDGIWILSRAAVGRGIEPFNRMIHLRGVRCTGHALLRLAPECFAGADLDTNREPLLDMLRSGDVQMQRIAAVCAGRLAMDAEDRGVLDALVDLCATRNHAVRAAAFRGIGLAARSSCDEDLRKLCLSQADGAETAPEALRALGMVYMGAGHPGVFEDIQAAADRHRGRPVRGNKHCKSLAACYLASGLLYLGTGSTEPLEFLLNVLALPRTRRMDAYRWSAAKALVMIEFPESVLGADYVLETTRTFD